jgi:gliding motility-associatede transport system auxiliary component
MKRFFDLVGWLGTAIVCVALALSLVPALNNYSQYSRPVALAGLVCVVVYAAGQWQEIARFFARRQARFGALAIVSSLVVLTILGVINYIVLYQNWRKDFTANKQFSLSDQSRNVLQKLDSPLQLMVFAKALDFPQYQDRLREYEYASKSVQTEYVDADKRRAFAIENQVQQYGTIVIKYKGRTERVTSDTEQDITNGIIKAVSGQQKKVYFTQGHGEKDTTSSERDGYNTIAGALGRENYTVEKLVLAQQNAVPDDATVVVIAGPKRDFAPAEIDALKKYLDKSGKLFLEMDPPEAANETKPNLVALAHDWGIDVGANVVFDGTGMGQIVGGNELTPVLGPPYPSHPITQRFAFNTLFPYASSATPVSGGVNGRTAQSIAETTQRSVAIKGDIVSVEKLLTAGKELGESAIDKRGPVGIASAVSAASTASTPSKPGEAADAPKPETRVVVVGDSDFAENGAIGAWGNRDFFMNIVGWLSQQENLISIRPKEADDRRVTLTQTQSNYITVLSLLVIPGLVLASGVYTWWRRR